MANKTATLKNQAGDNIYPNIVGDNRNAAIKDSATIKHTLAENKISLDLDETIKGKINAALQKPTGLTKTELVGVGTSGQENIEIGDNLKLENGKLSATGGGSGGVAFDTIVLSDDETTYTGTITGERPILIESSGTTILPVQNYQSDIALAFAYELGEDDNLYLSFYLLGGGQVQYSKFQLGAKYYSHFITMTNSTDNVALYLTIQNTDETLYTAETLASYLAGKKVLANGNLHGTVPTYIAGEGGSIKVYYKTPGDSNINPDPDVFSDLSSFAISDLVSPVA